MDGAVVMTDWFVVPERSASLGHALPESRAGMWASGTSPLWTWADGAGAQHWRAMRSPGVGRAGARVAQPSPIRTESRSESARYTAPVVLRMAPIVLRAMSLAAAVTGRDERDVWTEAAREWLTRHLEDDPEPPEPGASVPIRRQEPDAHRRTWTAIDALVRDLRAPQPDTEDQPAA